MAKSTNESKGSYIPPKSALPLPSLVKPKEKPWVSDVVNKDAVHPKLIEAVIESLNAAYAADSKAIWTLMNAYTPCNEALADHPTIQVIERNIEGNPSFTVSPLGLINGVIEIMTGHRVCIMTSEPNEKGQRTLLGFDIYRQTNEKNV